MTVDRFGIPGNVFGVHDEDFYGAIGRIAGLSALIEHNALTMLQTMTDSFQSEHTQLSADQIIKKACKVVDPVGDDENRKVLLQYFKDVGTALRTRNDFIHNLWPSQPGDQYFGWRSNRDKDTRTAQPFVAMQTNIDELKDFILTLVELVKGRDRVYLAAQVLQEAVRQERKTDAEVVS